MSKCVPSPRGTPEALAPARPAWVLLPLEAQQRGFRNALALRRWCHSRGVRIVKDGAKVEWVAPAEIDRAVAALMPLQAVTEDDHVTREFARITGSA